MAWSLDARIPLILVPTSEALASALATGPKAAVLVESPAWSPSGAVAAESFDATEPHALACACCNGRPPAATALDRLFQARIRSHCPWFERVVVLGETEAVRAQVVAVMSADAVTAARFRLA